MHPARLLVTLVTSTTLMVSAGFALAAEPVRVDVSRDTFISSHPMETEGSNGAAFKLKFKGLENLTLIDIDTADLQAKRVIKAQLHLHGEGEPILRRVTVSSIADDWVEGAGTSYTKTPGASSFVWARTGERRWGGVHPDITGVINGAGGSVWSFGDATARDADNWQIIPVDPKVVQSRIDGHSDGFCVMDDVGYEYTRDGNSFVFQPPLNRFASSKDDKTAMRPYFTLWLEDSENGVATRPSDDVSAKQTVIVAALLPPGVRQKPGDGLPVECRDEFGEILPTLNFFAAKGETLSFSVAGNAQFEMTGVTSKRFTMPLVEAQVDPLVPIGFEAAASALESQSTCIEIHVPKSSPAGRIEGLVTVGARTMPCSLTVWNFTLPDRLSFIVQLNAYGLPDNELAYYRLAHEHRTTLNCLPYNQRGTVRAAPQISDDGKWDWTAWDALHGPLLDGSAFADLPRSGVPLESFYLMLNENWPMNQDQYFKGGYWIETAYDQAYWQEFRAAAAQIAEHIVDQGWSETMFEFYLNNKIRAKRDRWDRGSAAWYLDEPAATQDFWALRRFGIEFWKGVAAYPEAGLVFRGDISRPQWQRNFFDNVINVEFISARLREDPEPIKARAEKFGILIYMYGSSNAIGTHNVANAAWCVEAWALGADGVLPWNTIGSQSSWQKADELSLFYPTESGPVPSLRMKTFRAGQQLVEYLTQYAAVSGESRAAIAAAVLNQPGMRAQTEKKNEDDAGKSTFTAQTHRSITDLRLRIGQWLDAQAPPARERWYNPQPGACDLNAVEIIEAVQH